jgi:hypothetical protein
MTVIIFKTSCIVINEACNCVYVNKNTRKLTKRNPCSTGHGTTSGTSEVELGGFNEENRKLSHKSSLHLHDFNA